MPDAPEPDVEPEASEPTADTFAEPSAAPEEVPELAAEPATDGLHTHVDDEWRRVSPKYLVVEVIGSIIGTVVVVAALLVAWGVFGWAWGLWVAIAVAVVDVVVIALEPRRVRSIAYRLREDDLLFRRGIMFHRQVAVPYGRMQLVDITRGPIARALGLADLKFVTAAAATAVTVPGLPADEADRLRDRLVELAESRRAGL